jgi:filamentous hemagglutinin family protein
MVLNPHFHRPRPFALQPLARAIALMLAVGGAAAPAQAQQRAFSAGWMAQKNIAQGHAAATGRLPNGLPASTLNNPAAQQQQSREQLDRSLGNLNLAAQAIAAQQAAQAAARRAAQDDPSSVPDGLAEGGLRVDTQSLSAGWHNAQAPQQSQGADGRTTVTIQQTGERAILNWETFNVGQRTTVDFRQQADWAVLNRVNDPQARPSQIQGRIKGDGTVLIANRNGIVFSGTSQVDTRNLVAAAAHIGDAQFKARGIYSAQENGNYAPAFTDAGGTVEVQAGARIATAAPASVTQGGGYALLLGREVRNAGTITAPRGQVQLAAGDFFIVRQGQGTAANQRSTTRGNEVAPQFHADGQSGAGTVTNTGLLQAPEGDITLAGRKVVQDGVAVATTTVDARGSIHLLNSASDRLGSVTVTGRALNAVLLDAQNGRTALDSQREALIVPPAGAAAPSPAFDNLSTLEDRRDRSRIEIVSGGGVLFEGGSTTLATGGQIAVSAGPEGGRSTVARGARLDVSGAVGVQVAMASNNVQIDIQGNEQRDAPLNRDTTLLNNSSVWIDRRKLLRVAAGTGGYDRERWYTNGGLLEVGGYLDLQGRGIGEWSAEGGSVSFTGGELVAQAGSNINLSGGTLDVQTGMIRQSWLKGSDGRLYEVSSAPADIRYTGLYRGFEDAHRRWGDKTTGYFYNPLIGPQQRLENGYTVGRDAGRLVVSTRAAVLEGELTASVYQGPRQTLARDAGRDGFAQSHDAAALAGQLVLGSYVTTYAIDPAQGPARGFQNFAPTFERVVFGDAQPDLGDGIAPDGPLPQARRDTLHIDSDRLNGWGLGVVMAAGADSVTVDQAIGVAPGGSIRLLAPQVQVNAGLTARGGTIALGNVRPMLGNEGEVIESALPAFGEDKPPQVAIAAGAVLDARGLWRNLQRDPTGSRGLPYLDGGTVDVRTTGDLRLATGSAIDVSSGAAVLADGGTRGGRGGDVTLYADMLPGAPSTPGLLVVDGDIRGFGVAGGGTLRMASGTAIAIGGEVPGMGGTLGAGQAAPSDIVLLQDYQVRAGDLLPVDYRFERSRALPGEALGSQPIFSAGELSLVLAADWTPPYASRSSYTLGGTYSDGTGGSFRVLPEGERQTLPAGFRIERAALVENFPTDYVVEASVFPGGIAVQSQTRTIAAGGIAPADFTVAGGSRVAAGAVFQREVATRANLALGTATFASGFANYDINGHLGVVVADGAALDVRMPVWRFADAARTVAGGSDPASALARWLPPTWAEDPAASTLSQRGGASLRLQSTTASSAGPVVSGPVEVREGAAITVDPGQSIVLQGRGITVNGRLAAPGGVIALEQPGGAPRLSRSLIWIGDTAVLDVAGRATTARDAAGRVYGQAPDGGTVRVGGALDWEATGQAEGASAFVVVRPGAVLDASGASASLDPAFGGTVAGDGGTIVLSSNRGLYLDGSLRAAAGGAGAAGGTLALALDTANYPSDVLDPEVLRHRELVLAATQGASLLGEAGTMAEAAGLLRTGTARVGVDRIEAGGFGNLSLLVHGPLSFDGNVALQMNQSLRLYAGSYAHADTAAGGSSVSLAAPYVRLAGVTRLPADQHTLPAATWAQGPSQQPSDGRFAMQADLVDVRDRVGFGVHAEIDLRGSRYTVDRRGFGMVVIDSRGDIRLLGGLPARGLSGALTTELATTGNMTLTAARIYPATGAAARIAAGLPVPDPASGEPERYRAGSVLAIRRHGEGDTSAPESVFGSLYLGAETVEQGGIVRAPLGLIALGTAEADAMVTERVLLQPGSLTSVSAAGLHMPYGGTVDGLSYLYNGEAVAPEGLGKSERGVQMAARQVDVQAEAVLDLSGGGTLAGAGFVAGRGGSVDILATPLANANPAAHGYSDTGNAVYAIVPGSSARQAPVAPASGFGMPAIGQQITIAAGVPGLPAGTYTLMPSNYALLPGAFRVELGQAERSLVGAPAGIVAGNGTYLSSGYLGVAGTAIRDALPTRIVLTPGAAVRSHSGYNETDYNAFVLADAARRGFVRGMRTADAKTLDIFLAAPKPGAAARSAFSFEGEARLEAEAGSGGFGGVVNVRNVREVMAADGVPTEGLAGASVRDADLNRLDAPRLVLNGRIEGSYGQRGRIAEIQGQGNLTVRTGAVLSAGELILASAPGFVGDEAITIEEGAALSTLGRGRSGLDSSAGYLFYGNGVLALSNGWFDLQLAPSRAGVTGTVAVDIGRCVSTACAGTTQLLSEGTIAIGTEGALTLADNVAYGTRHLALALAAVNLGEDAAIAAAGTAGRLPRGLGLNQARLDGLLAGNTATGAPALESLVLNARDAVNVFGGVTLDASSLQRLVLGTPAIHGYGEAGDVAAIRAGEFVWAGSEAAPGAAMADMLGDGRLEVAARAIVLGPNPGTPRDSGADDARIALGFSQVRFDASERIESAGRGALAVYHRQGAYTPGEGHAHEGGDLRLTAPVLTGQAASTLRIAAGGAIDIAAPQGAAANASASDALGATLELAAARIGVDGHVALPSGRLVLSASGDIALGANSRIDLAGRTVALFDVNRHSWGGDLVLASSAGHIVQAAGGTIDVSARENRAGTIEATALGANAGRIDLAGTLLGGASGRHDAGGTRVPYGAGEITLRAQTLADFAGLNARLNAGGLFGARRFQIRQGDLRVGDEVKAREVAITLDGGSLHVAGRIDASGEQVGAIRLAAAGNLRVDGTLDAHATGLRVDSHSKIIDSPNRATVELTSRDGMLTLGAGARIDLRAGTEVAAGSAPGLHDGRARGTLDLNARRTGGGANGSGEGADDVAIAVEGRPAIEGAKTVAVNAFRRYDDAPLAELPDVSGHRPQLITQAYLERLDGDSRAFVDAALANAALRDRLARLDGWRLRPGVEIASDAVANPNGDLTIAGDLDLSGHRYGPLADPARRGSGEPGVLAIRAAGNLNVHGSINDGFAPPAATPDDHGWVLKETVDPAGGTGAGPTPFGADVVVPIDGVVLDAGTRFPAGARLNYSIAVAPMTLPAGTVLPVDAVLTGALGLAAGTVVGADIHHADGSLAYRAGTVLAAGVTLGAGTRLGAGTALRADAAVDALTWPRGVALPVQMHARAPLQLARGSLIPANTLLELPGDQPVQLRPAGEGGAQGRHWAVAPMLEAGAASWDLQLVAGADLASADRLALDPASKGAIRLADTHHVVKRTAGGLVWAPGNFFGMPAGMPVTQDYIDQGWCDPSFGQCTLSAGGADPVSPAFSVVRTGTGDLDLLAAGDIRSDSLFGIYTAGTATEAGEAHQRPRGMPDGTVLGPAVPVADYAESLAQYRAWYPDQGGNVRVSAGGDLVGDISGTTASSVMPGNWLWRQGSGTAAIGGEAIPAAWWINFGAYAPSSGSEVPRLVGFTGIGALGGGDVRVRVGGRAGTIDLRGVQGGGLLLEQRSQGLVVAVGSTGRVGADGSLALTGGGDIDMRVAGALNPQRGLSSDTENLVLTGAIANLRGAMAVSAASIGSLGLRYQSSGETFTDAVDTRGADPRVATYADARGGINLVPGDTAVSLRSLGDLVLGGVADPGRGQTPSNSDFAHGGNAANGQGWFSLWSGRSAIDLTAAGGNLTPISALGGIPLNQPRTTTQDGWIVYPSILRAAALSGDIYYGVAAVPAAIGAPELLAYGLTLAPSPTGALEMLAAGSIYAGRYAVGTSGAGIALPTPFAPGFTGSVAATGEVVSNVSSTDLGVGLASLFAFGPNSAALPLARAADAPPIRFYAAGGDIVGLKTGETVSLRDGAATWYNAAAPVHMRAGRDIVNTGDRPGTTTQGATELGGAPLRGNLIVHTRADDVSIVSAGRDILYANFDVAGPGTLEVSAGRNLLQEDRGGIVSVGPVAAGDERRGASIALLAGVGAEVAARGLDMSAIRARYLDPANRAAPGTPLAQQPGKAAKTYEAELAEWLQVRHGFTAGGSAETLAYFDALPAGQQRIFLREVYYAELRAGGREYNDRASARFGSYLRGREMIATLFPERDAAGHAIAREGDITMFGASGVRTDFGGDIEMLAPGGRIVAGVQGAVPPAGSGVMTQGEGDIRLFSQGSVLLGLSRIMTTFGGDILAWSAAGDINAGRGSKTTVLFTPPKRVYDDLGNVKVSPQVPSSGAGIATLAPIPEVPPGDVDLIAPLGTIDAGEAGIRVSGNVNVAALQVVNAANIRVKGESSGLPLVATVNVSALTNASAAASQASMAAQDVMQRERAAARQELPSVFTVRVLGFGNEPAAGGTDAPAPGERRGEAPAGAGAAYNARSVIRVLGGGATLPPSASRQLTDEERANLQRR